MIPALASLSIGQRIAGALIGLAVWLAPAGAVWLHMHAKVSSAHDLGAAEARQACAEAQTGALAKAIADARAEWTKTQGAINRQAEADAKAIAADLTAARRRASQLTKDLQTHARAQPLPADCRADPERVRLYNAARGSDAPEG